MLENDQQNKNKVANVLDFILDFNEIKDLPLEEDNADWKRYRWLNEVSKVKKIK